MTARAAAGTAPGTPAPGPAPQVTGTLLGFARTLRAAGVTASPERVQTALAALDSLDVLDRDDVYWAGRLTLCAGVEDLERYDRAFAAFFLGPAGERRRPPPARTRTTVLRPVAVPDDRPPVDDEPGDASPATAATASRLEVLRHRDVSTLTAGERAAVNRLLTALRPVGPQRLSRRRRPAPRGEVDLRRSVRATVRRGGEPFLRFAVRRDRPRRLVLLLDVSGSMTPYADAFLRFAHAAARRRPGTDVFTLGTRLTRVTREIRARTPDAALAAVAAAVPDWSGGTRLGEQLKAFLDRWGQRGMARGAVVVVASDGWERGDVSLLGGQMARLHRLAFRVVWVNPHKDKPGYAPATAGMAAALPHVDAFVAGHSLAALERLAGILSAAEPADSGFGMGGARA